MILICLIIAALIILFINSFIDAGTKGKTQTKLKHADELIKWKTLYDEGVITEAEFNEKKRELLK
jgi:uncharacterized membrane protein